MVASACSGASAGADAGAGAAASADAGAGPGAGESAGAAAGTGAGTAAGESAGTAAGTGAGPGAASCADPCAGKACYVLFDGYTDALALYQAARYAGISARVSPTPRQARSECGSSLLIECADRARMEELAVRQGLAFQRIVELERQIDPARDRFC